MMPAGGSDPVWEGLLIGGAIGGAIGLAVVPRAMRGRNDPECSAIVKVAIGLPLLAGGMVVGGLIDKFHQQGHLVWTSKNKRRVAEVDPVVRLGRRPGAGVQLSVRFR
jgi:hypothetical protein